MDPSNTRALSAEFSAVIQSLECTPMHTGPVLAKVHLSEFTRWSQQVQLLHLSGACAGPPSKHGLSSQHTRCWTHACAFFLSLRAALPDLTPHEVVLTMVSLAIFWSCSGY